METFRVGSEKPTFFFFKMNYQIEDIINRYLEKSEYKLIDFVLRGERKNKVIEIFVDRNSDLNVEDLSLINRELWDEFEKEDISGEFAKIVVSSPGAERSFRYIWQLVKHTGRTLELKMSNGDTLKGKLIRVNTDEPEIIELMMMGQEKKGAKQEISTEIKFSDISESKVLIKFKK